MNLYYTYSAGELARYTYDMIKLWIANEYGVKGLLRCTLGSILWANVNPEVRILRV